MSRSEIITSEQIMQLTDNGRLIFEYELGHIPTKAINSPLRSDKNPSFTVFQSRNGIWCYKDFSNNNGSNAIKFVQERYNLNFSEALEYIYKNLNCQNKEIVTISQHKPIKKDLLIEYSIIPFTKEGHEYWNSYSITEEIANENDIYQISAYAINKKVIKPTEEESRFVYVAKDINGRETNKVKILCIGPNVEKSMKWKSNIESSFLWGLHTINKECKQLFITKSNKDAVILRMCGLCCINIQSENAKVLDQNMPYIQTLHSNLIINLGNDPQSVRESKIITDKYNIPWVNVPKNILSYGLQDNADYVKGFGLKSFKNFLRTKNIIK